MDLPSDINKALRRCRRLPTLPAVALHVVELANTEDVSIRDVADAVRQDPAMTVKILRTANSPMFGLKRAVSSVDRALQFMGLNATLSLALGFSMVRAVKDSSSSEFDYDAFWRRSITTATAAKLLAPHASPHKPEELMLVGLLQEFGMMVMGQALGERYSAVLADPRAKEHGRLSRSEQKALGTDHTEVGTWILSRWQIPAPLVEAVRDHHLPERRLRGASLLARVCAVASSIADIWDHPNPQHAVRAARKQANAVLGIRSAELDAIIEAVNREAPAIAKLFEVSAHEPLEAERLLEEAQDAREVLHLQSELRTRRTEQMATELASRLKEVETEAQRDHLTTVYSRSYIDDFLGENYQISLQTGRPLSVLFLDLDHFKGVNDRYGHAGGDEVLRTVGGLFQRAIRDRDAVGRYGGEEFIIVLPAAGRDPAHRVAERIRNQLEHTPILVSGEPEPIYVTISVGVATLDASDAGGPEELIRDADAALYEAKRTGRNRISVFDPLQTA